MSDVNLLHIYERQGETNAKLDTILKGIESHDKRIGALEKQWMKLFGWLGAIGTGIGIAIKVAFGRKA